MLSLTLPTTGQGVKCRLCSVGEHIRNYPATVHGPVLSGLHDGVHIADDLMGNPQGSQEQPVVASDQVPHSGTTQ